MGRLHRFKSRQGAGQLAGKSDEEAQKELFEILLKLRGTVVRRAIVAWERSQETFGDEVLALNDIDEALRNNRTQ